MPHGGGPGGQAGNPSGGPAGSDPSGRGGVGGTPSPGGARSGGPAGVAAEAAAAAAAEAAAAQPGFFDRADAFVQQNMVQAIAALLGPPGFGVATQGLRSIAETVGGLLGPAIGPGNPGVNDPEAAGGTTGGEGDIGRSQFLGDLIFPTEASGEDTPAASPRPLPIPFPALPPQVGEGFQLPPITPAASPGLTQEPFATTLAGILQRLGIAA